MCYNDIHLASNIYIPVTDITKDTSDNMADTVKKIMRLMGEPRNYGMFVAIFLWAYH